MRYLCASIPDPIPMFCNARLLALATLLAVAAAPLATGQTAPRFLASAAPQGGGVAAPTADSTAEATGPADDPAARLAELERQVAALEAERAGAIDFSGEVFAGYGRGTSGTGGEEGANSFVLDRWHLTAKARLSDALRFRGTTDIVSADPAARLGYTVIVKYAYVDWAARPWLAVRGGIIPTGWQNHVSGVWGHDEVAKTLAHGRGHVSIADLGVAAVASLPADLGHVAVQVQNGSGYRRLEADRFKDLSARTVLTPFAAGGGPLAGLQAGAHVYAGRSADGADRTRWGGLLAYETDRFAVALNTEGRLDGDVRGTGVGAFARARVAEGDRLGAVSLIGMVDRFDPSGTALDDREVRAVAGIAYAPTPDLTLTLDYQRTRSEAPRYERYDGTFTRVDAGVFLHAAITY